MALHYDLAEVKNYEQICFFKEGEDKRLRGVTQTLIFAMNNVGINPITEKNYKEFFGRIRFYEKLFGAWRHDSEGHSLYITLKDVRDHIGLRTNWSNFSKTEFIKRAMKRHEYEMAELIKFREEEEAEKEEGGIQ